MPVVPDTKMTGLLPMEWPGVRTDPYHFDLQLANPIQNLANHRHVPDEGEQIPPAALTGDVVKRAWYYA